LVSLFSVNDPYRIIGIILLLLIFRLPLYITGTPMILPELHWMVIGEKLSAGVQMYQQVWDYMGPLSASTYWIIDTIFGRSKPVLQFLSFSVVIYQCYLFNKMLLNNNAYNVKSYVPALVYMILMNCFFDFSSFSPVLLSITFLLLALNNIFKRIDKTTRDELFLNTGIYLGLAALFYLPSSFFLLAFLISLLFFTASITRRYLLLIYGFLLPVLLTWLYYFWHGAHLEFFSFFFESIFTLDAKVFLDFSSLLVIFSIPLLYLFISLLRLSSKTRYVNFQVKYQYVMFFTIVAGFLSLLITKEVSAFQLMILVPGFAFFISHLFLLTRPGLKREILFTIFWGGILSINLAGFYQVSPLERLINQENLTVKPSPWQSHTKGKKVLLLDENLHVYANCRHATPYFNWEFSTRHFDNLGYYDNLTAIFENFQADLPEIIIDPQDRAREIFSKIPPLGQKYRSSISTPGIYQLNLPDQQ